MWYAHSLLSYRLVWHGARAVAVAGLLPFLNQQYFGSALAQRNCNHCMADTLLLLLNCLCRCKSICMRITSTYICMHRAVHETQIYTKHSAARHIVTTCTNLIKWFMDSYAPGASVMYDTSHNAHRMQAVNKRRWQPNGMWIIEPKNTPNRKSFFFIFINIFSGLRVVFVYLCVREFVAAELPPQQEDCLCVCVFLRYVIMLIVHERKHRNKQKIHNRELLGTTHNGNE